MTKTLLITLVTLFCLSQIAVAQEVRNIDGYANNLQNPGWGSVGNQIDRITTNGYSDGMAAPAGANRPNPRHISNELFAQTELIHDPLGLSDFAWVFGQFIDHDITLLEESTDPADFIGIPVPIGDPHFDPMGTGEVMIPLMRNEADHSSGTDPSNPRTPQNFISNFIDGSGIYGSDDFRAFWVRSLQDGKLKMTTDNLLPFNTLDGERGENIDQDAPFMAMANPFAKEWFIAGDVRANENTLLLSLHTLFAREHNRICDLLKIENPSWTDRQLFQAAKRQVSGILQAIVYEEWLPALGIQLPAYEGYDASINPSISNVFSAAAFRYGHTTINSNIVRMGSDGEIMEEGNTLLKEIFFNPMSIMEAGGMEALLKGMSVQVQQEFDCKIVDDLRNFLFGPPGAGGLDLAAINIQRGRERGLADYNTIRADIGLSKLTSFEELSSDSKLRQTIQELYGDINDIDPWVGMLAEDHMPAALFGETAMSIVGQQFQKLRDGDRFYYENEPFLTSEEIATIKQTRMADVIRRNFDITIQDDVFYAAPHQEELSTSITDVIATQTLSIAPNPAMNHTSLSFTALENGLASYAIINELGQVIQQASIEVLSGYNSFSIPLTSNITSGFYSIRLEMDGGVVLSKLIVRR